MKKAQRLGDVCRLLDLQPYVLRYWETEFPSLRSDEGASANRVYGEAEIALLRRIKTLLYEEGYTIAGAKKKLESEPAPPADGTRTETAPLFRDEPAEIAAVPAEQPDRLDTANGERIETLRRGVAKALEEARAILSLLEPRK